MRSAAAIAILVALVPLPVMTAAAEETRTTRIVARAKGSDPSVAFYIHGLGSSNEAPHRMIPKGAKVTVLGAKCTSGAGIFAWPYLAVEYKGNSGFVGARNTAMALRMLPGSLDDCKMWMKRNKLQNWRR